VKRLFAGLPGAPRSAYDAVVIGAGIGGLVCGNLLARAGLRVLLVEQHYMVGGYCSTFRRRGFTFDAATHFYPLLGNPATITGALLADLGIATRWIEMDPVDHFHFPDGTSFTVPSDFDAYLGKVKALFPREAAALDRFFSSARDAYLRGLLCYFRGAPADRMDAYGGLTVAQALDRHFQDPRLKLLLVADCGHWGSPPSRTSFVFDSMLRLSYFLGNYYPAGGSQAFADELARRFEELGGHVLTRARALRILTRGGRARGIELAGGPALGGRTFRVDADVVVSNADLRQTCERLLDASRDLPPEYVADVRRLRPTHPCFLTHLGLRGFPVDALREAEGYYWESWDAEEVATGAFKVFVPTLFEPAMAPPGGQVVIVQKLTAVDYEKTPDWEAHKAEVEGYVMERLERILPGLARHVVVRLSASALTSHRYTLNHHGAMLGWEMSPGQLGEGRPATVSPIPNLFLVGHWCQPGGGVTPVIVSAMQAAAAITRGAAVEPPPLEAARPRP